MGRESQPVFAAGELPAGQGRSGATHNRSGSDWASTPPKKEITTLRFRHSSLPSKARRLGIKLFDPDTGEVFS